MSQLTLIGTDVSGLDRLPAAAIDDEDGPMRPNLVPPTTCQGGVTCYPSCWVTR